MTNLIIIIAVLLAFQKKAISTKTGFEDSQGWKDPEGGHASTSQEPLLDGKIEFIGVERWRGDLGKVFGVKDRDYYVRVSGFKDSNGSGVKALSVRTPARDFRNSMKTMSDWGIRLYQDNGGINKLNWKVVEGPNFRRFAEKEEKQKQYFSILKAFYGSDIQNMIGSSLGIDPGLVKI